jgi:hypothetical protein
MFPNSASRLILSGMPRVTSSNHNSQIYIFNCRFCRGSNASVNMAENSAEAVHYTGFELQSALKLYRTIKRWHTTPYSLQTIDISRSHKQNAWGALKSAPKTPLARANM